MAKLTIDWTTWRPRLLYGAFFLLALLLGLRWTLPVGAMVERLKVEAAAQGWQLTAGEAGPAGIIGLSLRDVTLKDKAGLTIPVERLDVTLPLWYLLTGRRRISVDAQLFDGRVQGSFDLGSSSPQLQARVEAVDLARALPLRMASGVDLAGVATGSARFTLPADEKGKPEGLLELSVKEAGVTGGKANLPGGAGFLTLPAATFGELVVRLVVKDGKGTFEKLAATGGDVELTTDGVSFAAQPRLEHAPLFGKARLKLGSSFSAKPEVRNLLPLLDQALAAGKSGDGYQLQVFGTLGHPQVRAGLGGLAPPPARNPE
jgi:type II secretion system protein N